jgi:Protein of unknown function (DUF3467)
MKDDKKEPHKHDVNFNLDPHKAPVLMVDTYIIGSNDNVVTFNFAQGFLGDAQQNVVSRVALTRDQAKDFLKTLNDHIEKFEV